MESEFKKSDIKYRRQIAWWFAELGQESEVDHYVALFPMLYSPLAKFAVGILLWNMAGKIDISNPKDVDRVSKILNAIAKSSKFEDFDETFNELDPESVSHILLNELS